MDEFFAYTMDGKTGVKMPRGDKDAILRYVMRIPGLGVQRKIVAECADLDAECEKRRKEIQKCETKIDALYAEVTKMESNGKGWFEGKLQDILLEPNDLGDKIPESAIQTKGSIPVITQKEGVLVSGYTDKEVKVVDDLPIIVFGDHSCTFKYVDFEFVRGADGTQLLKFDTAKFDCKFMCGYLSRMKITNANSYERHMKYLKNATVKIPPIEIQLKILDDEKQFDSKICIARKMIDSVATKKAAILEKYLKQKEV